MFAAGRCAVCRMLDVMCAACTVCSIYCECSVFCVLCGGVCTVCAVLSLSQVPLSYAFRPTSTYRLLENYQLLSQTSDSTTFDSWCRLQDNRTPGTVDTAQQHIKKQVPASALQLHTQEARDKFLEVIRNSRSELNLVQVYLGTQPSQPNTKPSEHSPAVVSESLVRVRAAQKAVDEATEHVLALPSTQFDGCAVG